MKCSDDGRGRPFRGRAAADRAVRRRPPAGRRDGDRHRVHGRVGRWLARTRRLAPIGIDFWADGRRPVRPRLSIRRRAQRDRPADNVAGVLIEDCVVRDYGVDIDAQRNAGSVSDVSIRRSVVIDAYATSGTPQGLYADGVHGLTLDGNVFDHNGWAAGVTGAAGMRLQPRRLHHRPLRRVHRPRKLLRQRLGPRAAGPGGRHGRGQRVPGQSHGPVVRAGERLARQARRRDRGGERQRLPRPLREQRHGPRCRDRGEQHAAGRLDRRQQQHLRGRRPTPRIRRSGWRSGTTSKTRRKWPA